MIRKEIKHNQNVRQMRTQQIPLYALSYNCVQKLFFVQSKVNQREIGHDFELWTTQLLQNYRNAYIDSNTCCQIMKTIVIMQSILLKH